MRPVVVMIATAWLASCADAPRAILMDGDYLKNHDLKVAVLDVYDSTGMRLSATLGPELAKRLRDEGYAGARNAPSATRGIDWTEQDAAAAAKAKSVDAALLCSVEFAEEPAATKTPAVESVYAEPGHPANARRDYYIEETNRAQKRRLLIARARMVEAATGRTVYEVEYRTRSSDVGAESLAGELLAPLAGLH